MTENKCPEVRKNEILDAALSCFNKNGYHKTSLEEIAADVGITKAGVYYYFKSKKALFIELFRARVETYFEELNKSMDGIEDTEAKIRQFTRKSEVQLGQKNDLLKFCLEFIFIGIRDPDIRREVSMLFKKRVASVSAIIQGGIAAGSLQGIDPDAAGRALLFLSMGFFLTYFSSNINYDPAEQYAVNMKVLFEGLRKK